MVPCDLPFNIGYMGEKGDATGNRLILIYFADFSGLNVPHLLVMTAFQQGHHTMSLLAGYGAVHSPGNGRLYRQGSCQRVGSVIA